MSACLFTSSLPSSDRWFSSASSSGPLIRTGPRRLRTSQKYERRLSRTTRSSPDSSGWVASGTRPRSSRPCSVSEAPPCSEKKVWSDNVLAFFIFFFLPLPFLFWTTLLQPPPSELECDGEAAEIPEWSMLQIPVAEKFEGRRFKRGSSGRRSRNRFRFFESRGLKFFFLLSSWTRSCFSCQVNLETQPTPRATDLYTNKNLGLLLSLQSPARSKCLKLDVLIR